MPTSHTYERLSTNQMIPNAQQQSQQSQPSPSTHQSTNLLQTEQAEEQQGLLTSFTSTLSSSSTTPIIPSSQTNPQSNTDNRLSFTIPSSPPIASSSTSLPSPHANDVDDLEQQPSSSSNPTANPRQSTRIKIINIFHKYIPIKQTYERINNGLTTGRMQSNAPGRFIGQGTDGVFRNLMAKPDLESTLQQQELNPPSYEEAAADAAPEYWDSNVISPMYEDEVFVEGLPVGNVANFVWNGLVSVAFQFVGFILCYLLHTSHAAKEGSKVGLGITLVMYGWDIVPANFGHSDKIPKMYLPTDPNVFDGIDKLTRIGGKHVPTFKTESGGVYRHNRPGHGGGSNRSAPYVAYGLIAFGLFIIIKGFVDFYRVKVTEKKILAPSQGGRSNNNGEDNTTSVTEQVENATDER
ncbi:uncharacterized protein J8A68_000030 [[Candida] subhashii]|uniref:Metal homeostatis protein BSD2 n=1 Tax=[Candida] subhashii TaxID=561895 RepID=A0A8J5V623_9ASCO|nr:uncharacterized protein J8A68_000030 [[Candida] subhashii]KAG7666439.1 hypothetical protein J8A68_000030 [[Candida] subhashii]